MQAESTQQLKIRRIEFDRLGRELDRLVHLVEADSQLNQRAIHRQRPRIEFDRLLVRVVGRLVVVVRLENRPVANHARAAPDWPFRPFAAGWGSNAQPGLPPPGTESRGSGWSDLRRGFRPQRTGPRRRHPRQTGSERRGQPPPFRFGRRNAARLGLRRGVGAGHVCVIRSRKTGESRPPIVDGHSPTEKCRSATRSDGRGLIPRHGGMSPAKHTPRQNPPWRPLRTRRATRPRTASPGPARPACPCSR